MGKFIPNLNLHEKLSGKGKATNVSKKDHLGKVNSWSIAVNGRFL